MECIILAGGLGTRLQAVVSDRPKPLALIGSSPFLDILYRFLARQQCITKVILAIGYRASDILEYYKKSPPPIPTLFSIEENLLGTGGAVKQALAQCQGEEVFILNGDSFLDCSLLKMCSQHKETTANCTLVVRQVPSPDRFGTIEFLPTGQISSFKEKALGLDTGWINGGIYLCNRHFYLSHCPATATFSIEQDFFAKKTSHRLWAFCSSGTFIDIGTRESYSTAQEILKPYIP